MGLSGLHGFLFSFAKKYSIRFQYLIDTGFSNMLLIVNSYENLERDLSESSKKERGGLLLLLFCLRSPSVLLMRQHGILYPQWHFVCLFPKVHKLEDKKTVIYSCFVEWVCVP